MAGHRLIRLVFPNHRNRRSAWSRQNVQTCVWSEGVRIASISPAAFLFEDMSLVSHLSERVVQQVASQLVQHWHNGPNARSSPHKVSGLLRRKRFPKSNNSWVRCIPKIDLLRLLRLSRVLVKLCCCAAKLSDLNMLFRRRDGKVTSTRIQTPDQCVEIARELKQDGRLVARKRRVEEDYGGKPVSRHTHCEPPVFYLKCLDSKMRSPPGVGSRSP